MAKSTHDMRLPHDSIRVVVSLRNEGVDPRQVVLPRSNEVRPIFLGMVQKTTVLPHDGELARNEGVDPRHGLRATVWEEVVVLPHDYIRVAVSLRNRVATREGHCTEGEDGKKREFWAGNGGAAELLAATYSGDVTLTVSTE